MEEHNARDLRVVGGPAPHGRAPADVDECATAIEEEIRDAAASAARRVRLVAWLSQQCTARAREELARGPRVSGQPPDEQVIETAVRDEVMARFGIGRHHASWLITRSPSASRPCCPTH
jgi:hypothetical protein